MKTGLSSFHWYDFNIPIIPLVGLFITLASGYRLAKFNIDEDQQTYFKGLPTPANALLILSLPLIMEFQNSQFMSGLILNPWVLIILTIISCYLLNSSVKLFALKFKTYSFKTNAVRYTFVLFTLLMLIVFQFIAIPIVILAYFITSLIFKSLTAI